MRTRPLAPPFHSTETLNMQPAAGTTCDARGQVRTQMGIDLYKATRNSQFDQTDLLRGRSAMHGQERGGSPG